MEPHRGRSQSIQPSNVLQYDSVGIGKRSYGHSEAEDSLRVQKRQRITITGSDRHIRSRERDAVEQEAQNPENLSRETTVIQDSQETTTRDRAGRGVNGPSQGITKYGRMDSIQAREGGSVDWRHSNPLATSLAPLQRISTPPSADSSKYEVATSDSDVHLPRSRAASRSKRKLYLIGDFSEQDRGQSTSTAVTTPLSVLQQPNNQSPVVDNKKLRRPTPRAGKNNTEDQQVTRVPPRQNVYEVIETDSERPSANPEPQDVSWKISQSYKWKAYKPSMMPGGDKGALRQRGAAITKEKDMQIQGDRRLNHEDQQQALEQEQNWAVKLAKQQAEQERSRLAFEAAEKRRLDADEKEKERQAKLESERVAAEKLRQEVEARKAQAEAEAEATREKDALAKAEAAKAAQLREKARLEAETKASLEEERNARLEEARKARLEETKARQASEAEARRVRLEMDELKKADKENDLKAQAILQSRQENKLKLQNLQALEATVRRAASTPAKAVIAHGGRSAAQATPGAGAIAPASTASPATTSNKRVTCTPFIPRGRLSRLSPATLHLSQATTSSLPKQSSPNVGLEDQMPMPPQLKRKVSFVDQVPQSERRSSSASSTFKQTTLVPPRLGITGVKSTPKRTPLKANSNGSKPSKGVLFSFLPNMLPEYI